MTGRANRDVVAALVASFLWACAYIGPSAVKPAGELLLVAGRYSLFILCGLYVVWVSRREVARMPVRRILFGLHLGVVGYFLFYLCIAYSVNAGSGFITALVVGASPVTIAIFGNVVEKRLRWRQLAAPIVCTLAGVVLLGADELFRGGAEDAVGASLLAIGLSLLASVLWAYFVVVNARSQRTWADKPDPRIWSALIGIGAGLGSVVLLPFAVATTPSETFSPQPLVTLIGWCVFLGVVSSWYGTLIWVRAARGIPAPLAGPLLATEAVFGAVLSLFWEHRMPTAGEVGGCLCIIAGVALYMIFDTRNARTREVGIA
ncbi:DMT family transporter [Actinosynnema sp. NPDC023587]|uniref:DMT family transporter n=1 Tax=Actinosynnema sp. NPDC023587 TaxID=3154695 RepID=UPI0033F7E140